MSQNPAITVSRSFGSGGTEAGFLAARQLGWPFCDRRILRMAADIMGHTCAELAMQEERPCGFMNHLANILGFGSPEAPFMPLQDLPLYSRDLFKLEREVMLKLVAHAPSVIVGRGGFFALKGRPATLHVRIDADPAWRAQFLVERAMAPNLAAARKAVDDSDRDRAAFVRAISGLDWHDPRNFGLVLDAAQGIEACARAMAAEAERLGFR